MIRKTIITILVILSIHNLSICFAEGETGGAATQGKTFCELWSDKKVEGKVCTELIEGVPCETLEGGRCSADNCYPAGGGKLAEGVAGPPELGTINMCYAVITPTGLQGFQVYVAMIYRYASWAIGILAVLVIIIGGIQMSLGGANQENVTKGRKLIFQAILGVALFFLIGVILRTINPTFFQ